MPSIINLTTSSTLNAKINEVKDEIPSITNLATTATLTTVEKKKRKTKPLATKEEIKKINNKGRIKSRAR